MTAVAPSPVNTLLKRADLIFTGGLFLTVLLIAFVFIKGFKTDLSQVRGDT